MIGPRAFSTSSTSRYRNFFRRAVEPILEELSLVPCPRRAASTRILDLARTLLALDGVGFPRVLRSVRDAADRDLGDGRGLRSWCYDPATQRDAGRLLVGRLTAQPFVDGPNGLFAAAEGTGAVDARVNGAPALGAGLAALKDGVAVILSSDARPAAECLLVELCFLGEDGWRSKSVSIQTLATPADVDGGRASLVQQLDRSIRDGSALVARVGVQFPRLRLGDRARRQIADVRGSESVFQQLVRHLRALDESARQWEHGRPFEPIGVTYSVESKRTLEDGSLGPMRDFPTPSGFTPERWSLHTKLTGGCEARLYFRPIRTAKEALVLVGYFGAHLPTVGSTT